MKNPAMPIQVPQHLNQKWSFNRAVIEVIRAARGTPSEGAGWRVESVSWSATGRF